MSEAPRKQFPYTVPVEALDELESAPLLPLTLPYGEQRVDTVGLVDSGATVNVLPYRVARLYCSTIYRCAIESIGYVDHNGCCE